MVLRFRILFLLAVILVPVYVNAEAVSAGFPAQSIWLSTMIPMSGEKVQIYTVLYNATEKKIDCTLEFLADGAMIERRSLSLDPGASAMESTGWTAVEGTHTLGARFSASDPAASQETSVSVSVRAPPQPSALQQGIENVSAVAYTVASTSQPLVVKAVQAVFGATEDLRNAGIQYLESKTGSTPPESSVAGSPAAAFSKPSKFPADGTNLQGFTKGQVAGAHSIASGPLRFVAAVGLFSLKSLWIFYPLLILAFYLLWRFIKRWANRPRI